MPHPIEHYHFLHIGASEHLLEQATPAPLTAQDAETVWQASAHDVNGRERAKKTCMPTCGWICAGVSTVWSSMREMVRLGLRYEMISRGAAAAAFCSACVVSCHRTCGVHDKTYLQQSACPAFPSCLCSWLSTTGNQQPHATVFVTQAVGRRQWTHKTGGKKRYLARIILARQQVDTL